MTAETKESRGTGKGGVGLEPVVRGDEAGPSEVGGGEGNVVLTTAEAELVRVGVGDSTPGVAEGRTPLSHFCSNT